MTFESIVSISAMIAGSAGIFFVLRSYQQALKSAQPDAERVRQFVATAPVARKSNIKRR